MAKKPDRYAISRINVDIKRFQNREKLNQAIVDLIAEGFDDNQFDPVVIWQDPSGKVWLLAGHHRMKGAEKAGKKTIKVRWFTGTEKEAIRYAKELSNANRTLESPLERAKIYRDRLRSGESVKTVQRDVEKLEGKNWRYIFNLTALNPDGSAINALVSLADNSDKGTQQNLEKISDWIGEARRRHPTLTNQHENEMYSFLLDNFGASKPAIQRKDVFLERVRSITQASFFEMNKPLNLKRIQFKSEGESEYEKQMSEIDKEIKELEQRRDQLRDRFNNPRNAQYVNPDAPDYDDVVKLADKQKAKIEEQLKVLRKKKLDLIQKKGDFQQAGLSQFDIFSQPAVQKIEKVLQRPKAEVKTLREKYHDSPYKYSIKLLQNAKDDYMTLTDEQVISIARNIRELIQTEAGAKQDNKTTSKRVLAPSFNNLLRWSNYPEKYDLVGIDADKDTTPTLLARKVKRARIFNLLGIK